MILDKSGNLEFGMSTKADGQMILHYDSKAKVNRKIFFDGLGLDSEQVVSLKQVHGNKICHAGNADKGKIIEGVDGLITTERQLILSITAADCLPIYVYDSERPAIGIAHAGWRGSISNIAAELVHSLLKNTSAHLKSLQVYIGPHIRSCHFKIKNDIIEQFKDYPKFIESQPNEFAVDLSGIVREQLINLGLKASQIKISKQCTFCHDKTFASYRRDKPSKPQGQVAYIYLK